MHRNPLFCVWNSVAVAGMRKMKSRPGRGPGGEQTSHLRRSCAAEKRPWPSQVSLSPIRQPTLVVAWVGRCRHASAHKGRPVFHRRAPELNTTAEADDRCRLCQAAAVICFHDQVMHNAGRLSRREEGSELESPTDLPGAIRSWGCQWQLG